MPPTYEKTEYAEISQFLRAPVTTDEEKNDESNEAAPNDESNEAAPNDESNEAAQNNLSNIESSTHQDNAGYTPDVEAQEILLEI